MHVKRSSSWVVGVGVWSVTRVGFAQSSVAPKPPPNDVSFAEPAPSPNDLSLSEPAVSEAAPPTKHAPNVAFWAGGRASFMAFAGSFFDAPPVTSGTIVIPETAESTGSFLGPGGGFEVNAGARLAQRFVPYALWEHGFFGRGNRFSGTDTTASSDLAGLGLRVTFGDVNNVGFVTDLSFGYRWVRVGNNTGTYTMTAFEFFRLGLGAEIRLSTQITLSPLVSLSTGSMSRALGSIQYSSVGYINPATELPYTDGESIQLTRTYAAFNIGCGVHFDLFGR